MSNSYQYNPSSSTHGKFLERTVSFSNTADRYFLELMNMLASMLDGDGTQDAHYATIVTRFGFPDTTTAHAAYNELSSAYAKTSGNGSVTNSRAARDQMFARFAA